MVLNDQHAELVALAQFADQLAELVFLGRVEPGGRFIQQQQLRARGQGAGYLQSAPIAVGQGAGWALGHGCQLQLLQQLPGGVQPLALGPLVGGGAQ